MTAPGSDEARLARIWSASGFIYHVSINGITGSSPDPAHELWQPAVAQIRRHSPLPVALGFGIRSGAQLAQLQGIADLLVVGSALVQTLCEEESTRSVSEYVPWPLCWRADRPPCAGA